MAVNKSDDKGVTPRRIVTETWALCQTNFWHFPQNPQIQRSFRRLLRERRSRLGNLPYGDGGEHLRQGYFGRRSLHHTPQQLKVLRNFRKLGNAPLIQSYRLSKYFTTYLQFFSLSGSAESARAPNFNNSIAERS